MLKNEIININGFAVTGLHVLIAVSVIAVVILAIVLLKSNKKKPEKQIDLDFILTLFDKKNIIKVDYIRNKIVMVFKDVELVDVNSLHEKGALGVSIIGDKIKFYFDGGEDRNQKIFNQIKYFIEG